MRWCGCTLGTKRLRFWRHLGVRNCDENDVFTLTERGYKWISCVMSIRNLKFQQQATRVGFSYSSLLNQLPGFLVQQQATRVGFSHQSLNSPTAWYFSMICLESVIASITSGTLLWWTNKLGSSWLKSCGLQNQIYGAHRHRNPPSFHWFSQGFDSL